MPVFKNRFFKKKKHTAQSQIEQLPSLAIDGRAPREFRQGAATAWRGRARRSRLSAAAFPGRNGLKLPVAKA
jgi:hypothetical protein